MPSSVLAAQLYTLRDYTKTPAEIAETLRRVKALGYHAVQLSALGPIDPNELKHILDDTGLSVCATHVSWERMRDEPQAVIEEHSLWNCRHVAIGGMPQAYRNRDGYHRFAQEASQVARRFVDAGMTWSYHNHSFELEKFGDQTGLAILFEESDPDVFFMELDTYWIQHGGGDPAAWIRHFSKRIPLVHLKDMAVKDNTPIMAEVGEGNLNWPEILHACHEAGVQWYIVEQDICQRDPFESLGISLRNLREMGLA
jgi:sugar phosphate isomerase/epimerase